MSPTRVKHCRPGSVVARADAGLGTELPADYQSFAAKLFDQFVGY